jgi:hypothetical protein
MALIQEVCIKETSDPVIPKNSKFVVKLFKFGKTAVVLTESKEMVKPVTPAKVDPTEVGFIARLKMFPLLSFPYLICISPNIG